MATQTIIELFIPIALFIIMFGMGLGLVVADFRRVIERPRAVALGCIAQLVALPLIGFGLVSLWGLSGELAVGVVLLAACPGGPTSNLFSHLARADTALSVTLTAISGTVTIATIPMLVGAALQLYMGADTEVSLPVLETMGQLAMVVLVPVSLGMWVRARSAARAARYERILTRVAVGLLTVLVVGAVIKERDRMPGFIVEAGPIVVALNVSTMALGFAAARLFGLGFRQAVTLTLEVGIQNAGLAIAIAMGLLGRTGIAIPAVIYGLLMYLTCAAVVVLARRRLRG